MATLYGSNESCPVDLAMTHCKHALEARPAQLLVCIMGRPAHVLLTFLKGFWQWHGTATAPGSSSSCCRWHSRTSLMRPAASTWLLP